MTIDEVIKYFEQNMPEWVSEAELYGAIGCYGSGKLVCNEPEGYVYRAAIKALEELKWYKSQNLIRRKDALECIDHLKSMEKDLKRVITLPHAYWAIVEIPKAEPKYSGCSYNIFCEKTDCKGCEAEPKESDTNV